MKAREKAVDYNDTLEAALIDHAEDLYGQDFIFQQDNASIQKAKVTMKWFKDKQIEVLDWPACCPDLNPIENLWGIMVRSVYKHGKQYNSVQTLKDAIKKAWIEIEPETLKKLTLSMKERLIALVESKRGSTKY